MRAPLLALLFACALALGACRSKEPGPSPFPDLELLVLSDLDHPPFAYLGEAGEPRGFEVDLVEELAARVGRTVTWIRHPFGELLARLAAGEGHLVAATLAINPERAARFAFTRPYFESDLVAVARQGAGEPMALHQLAGRRVGAPTGTHAAYIVRRVLPEALPVPAAAERQLVDRLLAGELDALVLERRAAQRLVALGLPVAVLEPRLDRERYALALSPERPRLRAELDRHLADLEREGLLAELAARYALDGEGR